MAGRKRKRHSWKAATKEKIIPGYIKNDDGEKLF